LSAIIIADLSKKIRVAEDGRFDVALFVYNFLQKEQGKKIIEACKKKNIGVTLMKTNPVNVYRRWKAGVDRASAAGRAIPERLIKLGEEYKAWLEKADAFKQKYSLQNEAEVRDAAIKFVLNHPGVHSACCAFNSYEELATFVKLSGKKLTSTDSAMLNDYRLTLGKLYCRHACSSCEASCPHHVPVNTIMRYNHYFEAQGKEKYAMQKYDKMQRVKADRCLDCSTGSCKEACPHQIPIQSLLIAAHRNLVLP
jgi:predicted aldo/keto reductase-like oxidoreductase